MTEYNLDVNGAHFTIRTRDNTIIAVGNTDALQLAFELILYATKYQANGTQESPQEKNHPHT